MTCSISISIFIWNKCYLGYTLQNLNKANCFDTEAHFSVLYLSIPNGIVSSGIYDGVYISQRIVFFKLCSIHIIITVT